MTTTTWNKTKIAQALAFATVTGFASGSAWSAAFGLVEQSASAVGTATAGAAAYAEDASIVWFNPAGMSLIGKEQGVLGGSAIYLDAKFHDNGSTPPRNRTANNDGGNFGDVGALPNLYYVRPINPQLTAGIGINAPFGLKTEYNPDWVGRYQGTKSDLKAVNINPSISYKLNERTNIGAGVSAQYFKAELMQAVVFGSSTLPDGTATIKGDSWAYGFNLGLTHQITPQTRLGVAYRSSILHELEGNVKFSGAAVSQPGAIRTAFSDGDIRADVRLPASLSISTATQCSPTWDVLTDITWTQWSTIQQLNFQRTNPASGNGVQPLPAADYRWQDSYRVSLGAVHQYSDRIKLRMGIAYDQSPVPDAYRPVRLPDNDRIWLSAGSSYTLEKGNRIDVGLAYIKLKNADINRTEGSAAAPDTINTVKGTAKGQAFVFSAQYVHNF